MRSLARFGFVALVLGVLMSLAAGTAHAGTIIKLSLGNVSPDIVYDGTTLDTADDGNAGNGDQSTAVQFLDFLAAHASDIPNPDASFTLAGLAPDGDAILVNSSFVLQNFLGGSFTLYDTDGTTILLSGDLDQSTLSGPVGNSTGALFTSTFGEVTGGTLSQYIKSDTLELSMSFASVATTGGGPGFSVGVTSGSPPLEFGDLNGFSADASILIQADPVPEPTAFALVGASCLMAAAFQRRVRG